MRQITALAWYNHVSHVTVCDQINSCISNQDGFIFECFNLLLRHLVELGCIKPLCDLLTLMDSKIVQVALNGLENILRLGELEAKRGGGINPYCAHIEEAYGMLVITLACDFPIFIRISIFF